MRQTALSLLLLGLATSALLACGGDGGAGGSGGGTSSSTGSATGGGGSGSGGSAPTLVNGCDPEALEDHTADATVAIAFGAAVGFKYSPACIKVKSGTMVTFDGDFVGHPLEPGAVGADTPFPDPSSPIEETVTGTMATFTIAPAGSYPYYCGQHYGSKMFGLIVAE
jgi:plastocyanin